MMVPLLSIGLARKAWPADAPSSSVAEPRELGAVAPRDMRMKSRITLVLIAVALISHLVAWDSH